MYDSQQAVAAQYRPKVTCAMQPSALRARSAVNAELLQWLLRPVAELHLLHGSPQFMGFKWKERSGEVEHSAGLRPRIPCPPKQIQDLSSPILRILASLRNGQG